MSSSKSVFVALLASTPAMAAAFAPVSIMGNQHRSSSLNVAVDPEIATKKEYQDVCGVNFGAEGLAKQLDRTKFLYPKHVEVIADFDDIVDSMVDNVVSSQTS
jgi:hypothetical protein